MLISLNLNNYYVDQSSSFKLQQRRYFLEYDALRKIVFLLTVCIYKCISSKDEKFLAD